MNQSIGLGRLETSALGGVAEKLQRCSREILEQVVKLVGSFFGGRPVARRRVGI